MKFLKAFAIVTLFASFSTAQVQPASNPITTISPGQFHAVTNSPLIEKLNQLIHSIAEGDDTQGQIQVEEALSIVRNGNLNPLSRQRVITALEQLRGQLAQNSFNQSQLVTIATQVKQAVVQAQQVSLPPIPPTPTVPPVVDNQPPVPTVPKPPTVPTFPPVIGGPGITPPNPGGPGVFPPRVPGILPPPGFPPVVTGPSWYIPVISETIQGKNNYIVQLLNALGVLNTDYSALNQKLRAKYGYLTNDQIAGKIIKKSVYYAAGVSFTSNIFVVIPVVGNAMSLLALPAEIMYNLKIQLGMILQIADLYQTGLSPDDRFYHAFVALGIVLSGVTLTKLGKFKKAATKGWPFFKRGVQGIVGLGQTLGARLGGQAINSPDAIKAVTKKATGGSVKKMSKLLSVVGLVATVGLSAAQTYAIGKVAKAAYREASQTYLSELDASITATLTNNDRLSEAYFKLMMAAVRMSTQEDFTLQQQGAEGIKNVAHNPYLKAILTLAQHSGITPDSESVYRRDLYHRLGQEFLQPNALNGELVQELKQISSLPVREYMSKLIFQVMLLNGHLSESEHQLMNLTLDALGLNSTQYANFFNGFEIYIKSVGGMIEDHEAIIGYSIKTRKIEKRSGWVGRAFSKYSERKKRKKERRAAKKAAKKAKKKQKKN